MTRLPEIIFPNRWTNRLADDEFLTRENLGARFDGAHSPSLEP